MPVESSGGADGAAEQAAEQAARSGPAAGTRSFKLRFAAQSEPGRSGLSAVRPLALPAPVTDKFYVRGWSGAGAAEGAGAAVGAAAERALARVHASFSLRPRDKYPHPVTTSHEYGWHCAGARAAGARGPHHIRDSAWLRTRLRLLAPDAAFKR